MGVQMKKLLILLAVGLAVVVALPHARSPKRVEAPKPRGPVVVMKVDPWGELARLGAYRSEPKSEFEELQDKVDDLEWQIEEMQK